ncbi:MAG: C69 family dipeptidase [Candidatus Aminicenantes bacterium]|nr:C69 family dipeptidase [Candidatus Aminicenantes bacterium]
MNKNARKFIFLISILFFVWGLGRASQAEQEIEGCTVIGVGREATVDGSVLTSHTDCCSECRVHVVPAKTFKKGSMAPVHWGMVYFGKSDPNAGLPLGDYGKVIGEIPQVERTYAYFHTGYSQMNEHQLAIGESTCSQKKELDVAYVEGVTTQIMTIEQAQVFALQRCKTAKQAVALIGELMETYGFLPSCGGSESLCIADPKEAWVMEIFSVGPEWAHGSGQPGAIWAAQRVPDDHIVVIPNYVRIREIEIENSDFMASGNYMQEAIDRGWYDPENGKPFIWQEAYAPPIREGSLSRLWLIYSSVSPNFKEWPRRKLEGPSSPITMYRQPYEGVAFYPFSVKPEKKISVQDIIAFQRSVFEETIYDMTADPAWLVPAGKNTYRKSPLTTPFPSFDLIQLLGINVHRTIATQGYGMVAQLRAWIPDPAGGIYWFYVDNPYVSTYVPIYAGVQEISPPYKTYDIKEFSENSMRWAVDFVEKLMLLNWQNAVQDLMSVRDPLEEEFFTKVAEIDEQAIALFEEDPAKAKSFLTELTKQRMDRILNMYRELRKLFLSKYSDDLF